MAIQPGQIQPGQYNFPLQRRADFGMPLQFRDDDDLPVDLTGWTVLMQSWNEERTVKYADWAIEYTDRATGQVYVSVTDVQTTSFPDEVYTDVMTESPGLIRDYWMECINYISEGYTA